MELVAYVGLRDLRLFARTVETAEDVEQLRRMRNHCREWMTRDRSLISAERPAEWWQERDPTLRACVYCTQREDVGFGLLRQESGRWWATLGVLQDWRGRGLGTEIYRHLFRLVREEVWIEVRTDNKPSLAAALRAGFIPVETFSDKTVLRADSRDGAESML